MRKILLIVLFVLVFARISFAYDLEKLSKASPGKLDYPAASALVLKDNIMYEYKNDGSAVQTEHEVIKILDFAGVKRFGEIEYVYNSDIIDLVVEEAKLLTPEGKLIEKQEIIEDTPLARFEIFNSIKVKKIIFKDISEDSVIEYKVKIISKKAEFKNNFWGISFFQDYEPILESVFTVSVPAGKPLFYQCTGQYKAEPEVKLDKGLKTYTWRSNNNPVIVKEAAAPPIYDMATQVRVSTFKSWDEFGAAYRGVFASGKSASVAVNDIAAKATAGLKTDEEKIKAVYDYIINNYECADFGFNYTGYSPHKIDDIIKYKKGNSVDLTLLFISMLKSCGIKAYPALTASRDYASVSKDIVYPYEFDRVITALPSQAAPMPPAKVPPAKVPPAKTGKGFKFVALTSKFNSMDNIPADFQGQNALVIEENKTSFNKIPVNGPDFNKEEINVESVIDKNGAMRQSVRIKEYGSNGAILRKFFSGFDDFYRRVVVLLMAKSISPDAKLLEVYFSDINKIDEPLNVSFSFESGDFLDTNQDLMYFNLPMFPLRNIINIVEGDDSERIYPAVINSTISSAKKIRITMPDSFEIKGMPIPVKVKNDVGLYEYSCALDKNKIIINSQLTINKTRIPRTEYKLLKDLIETAGETERQIIVVKQKAENGKPKTEK